MKKTAIFFAVLTIVGLIAGFGYGIPWDEPLETEILRTNLKEYAVRLFGADSELAAYYDSMGVPMVSETPDRDHGEAAFYAAAPLLLLESASPRARMLLWHAYNFMWFMLGVFSLYLITKELLGSRLSGCAAALMLYLSPRMFAHGHYNNKDIVLLSLFLFMLYLGLKLMKKPGWLAGALYALASAIATNTKIVGLWAFGVIGLAVIVGLICKKALSGRVIALGCAIFAGYIGLFILLTPASWADVPGHISYATGMAARFTGWDNYILFRGSVFRPSVNPLPWYYLPYMMLTTIPLYVLIPAAVGQVRAVALCVSKRARSYEDGAQNAVFLGMVSVLWLVPLAFAVISGVNIFNGWRHFYFLYAGVSVMAACGVNAIAKRFRKTLAIALCACFLCTATGMALNHPYQYAYFNPIVSLRDVENDLELDYWNVSVMNALDKLLSERRGVLCVSGVDIYSQYGLEISASALSRAKRARLDIVDYERGTAEYVVVNRTYQNLSGWEPEGYASVVSIRAYGREIMAVYRKEAGAQ